MKIISCPYCKTEINKIYENIFTCTNHNGIVVEIYSPNENINYIRLYDIDFRNQIFIDKDSMSLFCSKKPVGDYATRKAVLPIDSNLTPENFENKVKTYLTFL